VRGIARAFETDLHISGRTKGDGGLREGVAQRFEAAHCEPLELLPVDGPLLGALVLDGAAGAGAAAAVPLDDGALAAVLVELTGFVDAAGFC
jgi:hypothetical protein